MPTPARTSTHEPTSHPPRSAFAEAVFEIVRMIPPGTTLSYQEVAKRAGKPNAARAVANLMAQNYDSTVPCHRVIRSDGTLGGYNRGGPAVKHAILERERLST